MPAKSIEQEIFSWSKKLARENIKLDEQHGLSGFARFNYTNLSDVLTAVINLKEKYPDELTDEIVNVAIKQGDFEATTIAETLMSVKRFGIEIDLEQFAKNESMPRLIKALEQLQKNDIRVNLANLAENNYKDLPALAAQLITLKNKHGTVFEIAFNHMFLAGIPVTENLVKYLDFDIQNADVIIAGFKTLKDANFSLTDDLQLMVLRELEARREWTKQEIKNYFTRLVVESNRENKATVAALSVLLRKSDKKFIAEKRKTISKPDKKVKYALPKSVLSGVSTFFQAAANNTHPAKQQKKDLPVHYRLRSSK